MSAETPRREAETWTSARRFFRALTPERERLIAREFRGPRLSSPSQRIGYIDELIDAERLREELERA